MLDKKRVFDFIRVNPNASTKAIRKGSHVRNESVAEILEAGVATGELTVSKGRWGAQTYNLGTEITEPEPLAQILVPDVIATIPEARKSPINFGDALRTPAAGFQPVVNSIPFQPAELSADPNLARVVRFLTGSIPVTRMEISGGLSVSIEAVQSCLTVLLAAGTITGTDAPANFKRYTLTAQSMAACVRDGAPRT